MDAVLADALLSQCPDWGAWLRAVCGEEGALTLERAEALRFLLERATRVGPRNRGEEAQRAARELALHRCLPALLSGSGVPAAERPEGWRRFVTAAGGALRSCVLVCGPRLAERLAGEVLETCAGIETWQMEGSVEVLCAAAPWLEDPALLRRTVAASLKLLRGEGEDEQEEEKALLVGGRLLPALGRNGAALSLIWEGLVLSPLADTPRVNRTLLVLSALSDVLFPRLDGVTDGEAASLLDARLSYKFWEVVQKGLSDSDALCRKRARYLLKKAVDVSDKVALECRCSMENGSYLFWWCAEKKDQFTQFWENYVLIMETLEGNQIHVIKPVLPKLNSLYELAISEGKGCWMFHPSWHMCIYKRMFESENKTLAKESVIHFLEIWQRKCLPSSQGFSEVSFTVHPYKILFINPLKVSGQIMGTCPPLGIILQNFMATFFTSLPESEKSTFLLKFIQKMSNRHWCAIPVLFLSMALAHIPQCRALDSKGLLALRNVLQCTMITHQILLRGAAQCFLLKAAIHLIDTEKVSLSDISNFITYLKPEESLGRKTALWTMVRKMKSQHKIVIPFFLYSDNSSTERIGLKVLLNPLLDVLLKLGTNPYISSLKVDKSLQLLLKIMQTCSIKTSKPEDIKLEEQIQKVVSLAALKVVCEIMDQNPDLQLQFLPAVNSLKTAIFSTQLNHVLKKPNSVEQQRYTYCSTIFFLLNSVEEAASHEGWGKIVARYIHDQWVCLRSVLNNYQNLSKDKHVEQHFYDVQDYKRMLQSALEAITILPSDHVLPVFHCMKIFVSKLMESSESLCIEAFEMSWKIIFSLSNTQLIFWPNLKAFIQLVFDPEILVTAARFSSETYLKIKEIMFQMIELSSTKTGIFNVLVSHCCQSWLFPPSGEITTVENAFSNAGNYIELLIEACLFGTIFRRDQRLVQEVYAFVEHLGDQCSANVVTESKNRDDHYVRVCAIKFICLLDESNKQHKKFIGDFVMKLLDKGELMSKSKVRYYVNSLQHRIENRLWQTLLVLFPKLDEDLLSRIVDRILQAGHNNNQASVKYLIEWNIILILHKFPHFLQKFWNCFNYDEDQFKTSICTFLAVLSHFDIILQNTSEKISTLKKALIVVLQWCFHHNFSIRLYALIALKKIWGMCKASHVNDFDTLTSIIECSLNQVELMHGTGNAKKNWQRIQKHFFFEYFHPLKDYCLETIFYTLPRLSETPEEEWISLSKFTAFRDIPLSSTFPSCHSQTTLLDLKPNDWTQQDIGLNLAEPSNERRWVNVQKKIIPCKASAPDLDLELIFQDRATKLGKSNRKLIVVASLIDKPTNLGGLCRTCEIFGVSALTVSNLHYINDKQFQHLSVSAEQWLSVIEVKPFQLIEYLEQKKTEGYFIIGVEQTAKSCNLMEYCFPEKSLLLLGNEHEGIPANVIQHLDTCVEIPQQGVIRSLNVHVSGALLIWEYTRQQMHNGCFCYV
uniref:tRNA (guanosine(18)-2'-O)-methyltransferase TARBP1 n=1 Tax=Naja naja TaxID=35670 RepID=A0A8C6X300_NAJNA